jgi:pimeloyl-ACP methyl ester carboxylesterase
MSLPEEHVPSALGGGAPTPLLPPGCVEGYVATNGTRLHYVAAGTGPLVLLLHGFPEFWFSWRQQLPALAQRFHVVALDLRGYNLSDKPRGGYDVVTLSDDIRGVVEAFGERRADIVGHDWGGMMAWVFAIRAPERLRRLAILNAPHPAGVRGMLRNPTQLRRSSYIGLFQLRGSAERAIQRNDYSMIRGTFRSADRSRTWLADADVQTYVDAIARPDALSAALAYYRVPQSLRLLTLSPMRVITAPTLVLWGEQDPYLGRELLDGLDDWVDDLRVQRFPTAGHWLNQQEAGRVNEALLAFLSGPGH